MKRFKFPKGIRTLHIPILLTNFEPWQDQIEKEMIKLQNKFGTSKTAGWNYRIENGMAEIYVTK